MGVDKPMTDLAHTYTSDIQYQETQVKAADTQFTIQRMGQNCNFLIDNIAPVVTELNTLATTICRFTPFQVSGFMSGPQILFDTGGPPLYMAVVFIQPGNGWGPATAPYSGVASIRNALTFDPNWTIFYGGGQWKCTVAYPGYTQLVFNKSTNQAFNIWGVAFHG